MWPLRKRQNWYSEIWHEKVLFSESSSFVRISKMNDSINIPIIEDGEDINRLLCNIISKSG
jgi:hypothetical protein